MIQQKVQTIVFASATFAAAFGGLTYLLAFAAPPPRKVSVDVAKYKAEIRKAIARLDKLEPNWRLKDLLASRKKIPDEKNGALIIQKAFAKLPKDWDKWTWGGAYSDFPPPPVLMLPTKFYREIKENIAKLRPSLKYASQVASYPDGQFELTFLDKFLSIYPTHIQRVRETAVLLEYSAHIAIQDKRFADAASLCAAIFHTGRTLSDEPNIFSQLVRCAIAHIGTSQLERILAHGKQDSHSLLRFQKLLERDIDNNFFITGMRGELAGLHDLMKKLTSGKIRWSSFVKEYPLLFGKDAMIPGYGGDFYSYGRIYEYHAFTLRCFAKIFQIHIASPVDELIRIQRFLELMDQEVEKKSRKTFLDTYWQAYEKIAGAEIRTETRLQCARCGVATERFHLSKKRWPKHLSELVRTGFLTEVPIDLFSGKPLKFRKTADGVVIFSVMREFPYSDSDSRHYKGDALDNAYKPRQINQIEFRLWNPDKRRQPAPPEKKPDRGFDVPPEVAPLFPPGR